MTVKGSGATGNVTFVPRQHSAPALPTPPSPEVINLHTLLPQQNAPKASQSVFFFSFSENYFPYSIIVRFARLPTTITAFHLVMCLKYHRVEFQQQPNSIGVMLNKQVSLCSRCRQLMWSSIWSLQRLIVDQWNEEVLLKGCQPKQLPKYVMPVEYVGTIPLHWAQHHPHMWNILLLFLQPLQPYKGEKLGCAVPIPLAFYYMQHVTIRHRFLFNLWAKTMLSIWTGQHGHLGGAFLPAVKLTEFKQM